MLPKHVLIIPDGNRRFAKSKGLSLEEAYRLACETVTTNLVKQILIKKGIPALSLFGLSYDNALKRNEKELNPIYNAHISTYRHWLNDPEIAKNVKFSFIGPSELLPTKYLAAGEKLVSATAHNKGGKCNILIPYDGQQEVVEAARVAAKRGVASREGFFSCLQLSSPIELIVRTGKEKRLSSCPLYQAAYAEIFFEDFFYPEFTTQRLERILREFDERERRFGK